MTKRLHVANLAVDTGAAAIKEAFQSGGRRVVKVDLVMSRDPGRSRGFAFVEMETDEDAREAVRALHGAQIGGREVRVTEAHPARSRFGGFTKRPAPVPAGPSSDPAAVKTPEVGP